MDSCCHKNLWQASGYLLATVGHDLTAIDPDGARRVVAPSLGSTDRVHYCNLPSGATAYSNGLIAGITDGRASKAWAIAAPHDVGGTVDMAGPVPVCGQLYPFVRWAGGSGRHGARAECAARRHLVHGIAGAGWAQHQCVPEWLRWGRVVFGRHNAGRWPVLFRP